MAPLPDRVFHHLVNKSNTVLAISGVYKQAATDDRL